MNLSLKASDFELFGVPEQFDLQPTTLDAQWKALLREAHPDRFAAQGAAAQRLAMQWSVRINEAHQRLKDPLKRASYLCERWGVPVNAERNTAMPTEFLMQQMAWREELEEAEGDVDALEVLLTRTRTARQQLLQSVAQSLGDDVGPSRLERAQVASGHVRAMMFVERFSDEINQRLVKLES